MDIDSVYRLYFRDVFLFLQGLTHNEALAEELALETFFTAMDGLKVAEEIIKRYAAVKQM